MYDPQWISAVVITRNEEANIERCLRSLTAVTNDIVVVDSGSQDRTLEIASKFTDKLVTTGWKGYGESRNLGAEHTSHPWVLALDADEVLSPALIASLKTMQVEPHTVYAFDRINNFNGRWLKHGSFYPDWKLRLYPKEKVEWDNNPVHESLVIPSDFQHKKLDGRLLHYTAPDPHLFRQKMDRYARLGAEAYFHKGEDQSRFTAMVKAAFRFLKSYFFRAGFLDGKEGFEVGKIEAEMVLQRQRYLKEMYKGGKG